MFDDIVPRSSFRSPYSYLALRKITKMVADYDLAVNLRPVYPLAVRVPGFFKKTNPQFLPYVALDAPRVAQHENIPYRFSPPRPDRAGLGDARGRRASTPHPSTNAAWRAGTNGRPLAGIRPRDRAGFVGRLGLANGAA